ncbi:PLP-dependent aminotransferase family protein [Brevibacillus laterosporus]|uniref:MocR-like pyridoxine biosynthesis transcription factor PdxR n=1 Tax=Brevibacillus laterosporus TaxID=1465 RepID=UPI001443AF4F|nr:PLP-dependent aminotransferase family protein [Brevibacillus laterosporus]NKQ19857.1 PLP-dependent aminotransferase family protein [Brevibacillus laterosporus]WNX30308.1 PLP-dependent aminotransferase family protein [Brevibacillus laterosporus]
MEWQPNRKSQIPIYKQISQYLEQRITNGEYPSGTILPSERLLSKELDVNRSTIVAAYEELRASGIIESLRGKGTIVSRDIWGASRKRIPNWEKLIETGSFLPNTTMMRSIRKETFGLDLIDLASGELSPDLSASPYFQNIMSNETFTYHVGYDHPHGNLKLRETIALHLKESRNISATPSSILITSGAQQALYLIVQCLLQPGDAVAIEDPSYCYSLPLFKSAGLRTFLLPVDDDGVNPDDIVELHKQHRIKMVFLNPNFQNPNGSYLSLERRKRVLEISSDLGIPIIEDDPYSLTAFDNTQVATLKSLDENGTVLYVSSLSKIVASGLRIGWIFGPQTVIERLADAKQQIDFGHSIIPEWIATKFLSSEEFPTHLRKLRNSLAINKDKMTFSLYDQLEDQVEFLAPEGGIHIWCRIKENVNEQKLVKEAIRQGVVYVPGSVFGTQKGYVRFTFGRVMDDQIHEAISRFSTALRNVKKDT